MRRQAIAMAGVAVAQSLLARRSIVSMKASIPPTEDIDILRADLVNTVFDSFISYLASTGSVVKWRSQAGRSLIENIPSAFYSGFVEGGADETDAEDEIWINSKVSEQVAFMGDAFESLREQRIGEAYTESDIQSRANLWGAMLDGVYSEGQLRASKNKSLEFGGPSGKESCGTCMGLLGKRMRVKTIIAKGLIPSPGNKVFECGCWACEHFWLDPRTGERVTL